MQEIRLILDAGHHDRSGCPVFATIPAPAGMFVRGATMVDSASGSTVTCQLDLAAPGRIGVAWIVDHVPAGEKRGYVLTLQDAAPLARTDASGVTVNQTGEDQIEVRIDDEVTTNFWYNGEWDRPFLHPVIGPYGHSVTRLWPLIEGDPHDQTDHPHQKGIWVAWGNIEGVNNWAPHELGGGKIVVDAFDMLESGPVYGRIRSRNRWMSHRGTIKTCDEIRDLVFYRFPRTELVMIDMRVTFIAGDEPVHFIDTKEGGICSVRLRGSMDVARGLGGLIENSFGGINEAECWGKRAQWCDYSGPVEGKTVGVTVYDQHTNPASPTYWHVRDYGLMTANPFGRHDFVDKREDGTWLLRAGDEATFSYRIYVHKGRAGEAAVADKYHDFANPPTVTVEA
jgi:hypothetical protein